MTPQPEPAPPGAAGTGAAPAAPAPARSPLPDLTRAIALFGIAVVNVGLFAYPSVTGYAAGGLVSAADHTLLFIVMALFAFKSYTLFAFCFGLGFGVQIDAAAAQGQAFLSRYGRRLLGLAALGALNVVAFFYGDILLVYAVLGAVLLLARNAPVPRLVRWGRIFIGIQVGLLAALAGLMALYAAVAPDDLARELARQSGEAARLAAGFGAPQFHDVALQRVRSWFEDIGFLLLIQGPGVFAGLLLGLAAWRSGVLSDLDHPVWRRCRRHLPLGLLISAVGAALMVRAGGMMTVQATLGLALVVLGSPLASAGYLGWLARWAQAPAGPLRQALARAGSASLSAYLLQGLLMSLVFSGYGLGWYAQASATASILVGALAGGASLLLMALWRRRFARGPFEALLRRWTYGARTR